MPSTALLPRLIAGTTVALLSVGGLNITASSASASVADPGTVSGWGYGGYGSTTAPASLEGKDVTEVSAGYLHSLALTSDGAIVAWGYDGWGTNDIPASLASKTVTAIAAGVGSDLALTSDGQVTAWGTNGSGELDIPASLASKTVTAIAAGGGTSMALSDDGKITAWGSNDSGLAEVPASLADETVTAIATGQTNSVALTSEGKVTVWGPDYYGVLEVPASVADKTVTAIDTGSFSVTALTSDGQVTAWGRNDYGQNNIPAVLAGKTVTAISASDYHSLGLTDDGVVYVWGHNGYGEGVDPSGLTRVTRISAGNLHNLAVVGGNVASSEFGTGVTATVTGTPKVGTTLTAGAGDVAPAADSLSYRWFADDVDIADATDSTFTPTSDQEGAVITVEVTAVKAGYDDSTDVSDPTVEVAAGSLGATGSATITGTLKVGETLTAAGGVVTPTPDSLEYQWYADDVVIDGADTSTFTLTAAQKHKAISVQVTAVRAGYTSLSDTSANTTAVATDLAPRLDLGVATTKLRRGQSTRLTWTSDEASSLVASGGWSGARNDAGTMNVRPTRLGGSTYFLSATNGNGTTAALVTVQVRRQAKVLRVGASNGQRLRSGRTVVTTVGLDAREPYVLRINGFKVATGTATLFGRVNRKIALPTGTRNGNATVTVTGSESDRIGRDTFRVLKNSPRAR